MRARPAERTMNAFADMLFSSLLGWVRGLMQSLWGFFSSGGSGGFFAWIGDHFLVVTVILCLAGAAADLLIGFFREEPAPLVRGLSEMLFPGRDGMPRAERKRFEQGYEDGIDMQDLNPDGENHIPLFESNYTGEVFFPDLASGAKEEDAEASAAWMKPGTAAKAEGEERHRRGARYERTEKKRLFHRVNSLISSDDEDGLLDRLPTRVDRKGAFHDPVYPNRRAQ